MTRVTFGFLLLLVPAFAETQAELQEQVRRTETAFAKTMADRDHAAFATFLAPDAVFFSGSGRVSRGPEEIARAWKSFYEGKEAPFSWQPEQVVVLASGTLAVSSGPVTDASGARTATFTSVWRREAGGKWRIIIDKGCRACPCAQ